VSRAGREKTKDKDRDGGAREGEDKEDDDVDPFIEVEREGASEGARGPSAAQAYQSTHKANFSDR
jgi:hypothetical protein